MNEVQIEDCQIIGELGYIEWERFRNTTILVTGSTGLIGSTLVNTIAYNSVNKKLNCKLVLPVRNPIAAHELFDWTGAKIVPYSLGDELKLEEQVDYIVHLASPTSSKYFTTNPVDTLTANFNGTQAILEYARNHPIKKMIICSTMEVYGLPDKGTIVKENDLGSFDTMNARNSYPLSKIACESLCFAYYSQYQVPSVIFRVTQTFGPGVKYDDGRVFAEFMRCVLENRDIVLKTKGLTERCYLYTFDCASAILVGLLNGESGEAYTIANQETYCSISGMAELVAHEVAKDNINVVYDLSENISKLGYADTLYMNLDVSKIKKLGWKPRVGLLEMYNRMISGLDLEK